MTLFQVLWKWNKQEETKEKEVLPTYCFIAVDRLSAQSFGNQTRMSLEMKEAEF